MHVRLGVLLALTACAPSRPVSGPGKLARGEIQHVVRTSFGRFRMCYEEGLRWNPRLGGRVVTYFVIESDGRVTHQEDHGSDLPDRDVVACVVNNFGTLHFPDPEGGFVTVVFPIVFSPYE